MTFQVYVTTKGGTPLEWTRLQTEDLAVAQKLFEQMQAHTNFQGSPFVLVYRYGDLIIETFLYAGSKPKPVRPAQPPCGLDALH